MTDVRDPPDAPVGVAPDEGPAAGEIAAPGRKIGPLGLDLAVFGGFVVLGVLLWWHVWITGSPSSTITCQCGDPSQELWFLSWTPWAIIHGHSPFLSNAIYAGQGGVNMMVNTSWMVPSIILAPITWLFGPIASFNVAAVLAPAISAWCFFVAARRVTDLAPARILGGLLYGFSPFVLQNDPFGHLNFTLLYFPPLAFILLYDLIVDHRRSAVRTGVWLAVLVVVQFFTSTELLAIAVLVIAVTLVAVAIMAPRRSWAERVRIATAAGVAAGIVAVTLAYPLWYVLAGPRHIVGLTWGDSPQLGMAPSAVLNPGVGVHASSFFDVIGGYSGGVGPNAGPLHLPSLIYFGPALIGFLAVSVVTWFRSRLAWALLVGTVMAWLFSFGTALGTEGTSGSQLEHPWWAPWRVFAHVPLVSDIIPNRFAVMVTFGVSMLLVISLDRWRAIIANWFSRLADRLTLREGRRSRRRGRWVAGLITTVVGVAVIVPVGLANSVPFGVASSSLPAWFATDAKQLPTGTIVLVVPFRGQRAEGWQAQAGLHFALAGGFAVVPGPDGHSVFVSPPTGAVAVLGRLSPDQGWDAGTTLPSSAADVADVRSALLRWRVGVTVVIHEGVRPDYSAGFLTAVYGRLPSFRHGAWVWTGPPGTPSPGGADPSSALVDCSAPTSPSAGGNVHTPMAMPDCVLRFGSGTKGSTAVST